MPLNALSKALPLIIIVAVIFPGAIDPLVQLVIGSIVAELFTIMLVSLGLGYLGGPTFSIVGGFSISMLWILARVLRISFFGF